MYDDGFEDWLHRQEVGFLQMLHELYALSGKGSRPLKVELFAPNPITEKEIRAFEKAVAELKDFKSLSS